MKRIAAIVLLGLALLMTGCGTETATVSGRVVFSKPPTKPEEITVVLVGKSGQPVTALVAPDGTYTARGVDVGEVRVGLACQPAAYIAAVEAYTTSVDEEGKPKAARRKPGRRPSKPPVLEHFPNPVPAKYWDPLQSPLKFTAQVGENSFDIQISN